MRSSSKVWQVLPTIVFSFGMLCVTVYVFFPGFLSMDSEWQLQQAKNFYFFDWHPPIMSWLWSMLNHIYYGPTSMLVFQNLVYWLAVSLFAFQVFPKSNWRRISLIAIFSLFPPIYIQLGSIWKDTSMAASLFLVSGSLLFLEEYTRAAKYLILRIVLITVILVFLFYGFALRLNSAPAIIMLAFWLGTILFKSKIKSLIFAVLLLGLFYAGNRVLLDYYLHPVPTYPYQQVAIHDLAAISIAKNQVLFPKYAVSYKQLTVAKIKQRYKPDSVGFFIFKDILIPLTNNPQEIHALTQMWYQNILANPWPYLKHRVMCFVALMISCIAYIGEVCQTPYAITFHATFLYKLYCKFLTSRLEDTIFHGWIYVINSLFAAVAAWRLRQQLTHYHAILYVAMSGFLYTFGGIIYTPACEFRYLYWTVTASLFAMIFFVKDFFTTSVKSQAS